MKITRTTGLVLLTASFMFLSASQVNAQPYTFTDLGTLGGSFSSAQAINNAGQVVGFSMTTGDAANHATLWNGTNASDLGTLGGTYSRATAISHAGQIVGNSNISGDTATHATMWNGTTTFDLGTLGGTNSYASAINNAGQIVGYSDTSQGYQHATVWSGSAVTDLAGQSSFISSQARAIDSSGQVTGAIGSYPMLGNHATVWNGTNVTNLETQGTLFSWGNAINDAGQVVGFSGGVMVGNATLWNGTKATNLGSLVGKTSSEALAVNSAGIAVGTSGNSRFRLLGDVTPRATLWNGTTAIDLNSFLDAAVVSAGWVLNSANGINDNGLIVGDASNSLLGVYSVAFLLTPVPEPETCALMLAGLGMMGFLARRRKNKQVDK